MSFSSSSIKRLFQHKTVLLAAFILLLAGAVIGIQRAQQAVAAETGPTITKVSPNKNTFTVGEDINLKLHIEDTVDLLYVEASLWSVDGHVKTDSKMFIDETEYDLTATYSNLPIGKYRVNYKAQNVDEWDSSGFWDFEVVEKQNDNPSKPTIPNDTNATDAPGMNTPSVPKKLLAPATGRMSAR